MSRSLALDIDSKYSFSVVKPVNSTPKQRKEGEFRTFSKLQKIQQALC
jgi:hypothetical protein